jgi:hypothetical protein
LYRGEHGGSMDDRGEVPSELKKSVVESARGGVRLMTIVVRASWSR